MLTFEQFFDKIIRDLLNGCQRTYFLFYYKAILIAISVIVIALQTLFSFIPWLGRVLGAAALAYGATAQAHALGSLLYLDRERILAAVR